MAHKVGEWWDDNVVHGGLNTSDMWDNMVGNYTGDYFGTDPATFAYDVQMAGYQPAGFNAAQPATMAGAATATQAQLGDAAQMEAAYTVDPSLATATQGQAGQGVASQMQAAQGQAAQGISAQGMAAQIGDAGTFGGHAPNQAVTGLAAQAQAQGLGYDPSAGAAGLQSIMQSQINMAESQRALANESLDPTSKTNLAMLKGAQEQAADTAASGALASLRASAAQGGGSSIARQQARSDLKQATAGVGQQFLNTMGAARQQGLSQLQASGGNLAAAAQTGATAENVMLGGTQAQANLSQATNMANLQNQQQMALANMQAQNQQSQFNAANEQQAGLFNIGQENQFAAQQAQLNQQMAMANLQNQQQMNMGNMGNQQQMNLANLQNQQGANQANLQAMSQMDMANLQGGNQFGLANMAAQNQFALGNQGASNQANMFNAQQQQAANQFNASQANTFANQDANMAQQANMFNAQSTQQINLANQAAANNQAQFNAQAANQMSAQNAANQMANSQFNAANQSAANLYQNQAWAQAMYGAQAGEMGNAANSGSAMGTVAGFMLSDTKLKDNIKSVGILDNGLTVYSFNYKNDPNTHIGLMAQEVEKVNPKAVTEVDGFKLVNYKEAVKETR